MSYAVGMVGDNLGDLSLKLRDRAERDLYFTMTTVFGRSFLNSSYFHPLICSAAETSKILRTIYLAPRGGGKSEVLRAKAARLILSTIEAGGSPHIAFGAYDYKTALKNARAAVNRGINSELAAVIWPKATTFLKKVGTEFNTSGEARWHEYLQDSHDDPHLKVAGINGGLTSGHFQYFFGDDMIDEVNARSETECKRAKDWISVLPNILEDPLGCEIDLAGTHYSLRDTYSMILRDDALSESWTFFIHPGYWEEFNSETGKAVMRSFWSEKYPVDRMHEHMRLIGGPYFFQALIQQNPIQQDASLFQAEWLKLWKWHPSKKNTILRQSHEHEAGDWVEVHLVEMTIVELFDPALGRKGSSSDSAIVIVGVDPYENVYLLDYFSDSVSIHKAMRLFQLLGDKWKPIASGCEDVLFQELVIDGLKGLDSQQVISKYHLQKLRPAGRSKDARIIALQHIYEEGRFFINQEHVKFYEQYVSFTLESKEKRDILDALAYGPDIWWPGKPIPGITENVALPNPSAAIAGRDSTTGY